MAILLVTQRTVDTEVPAATVGGVYSEGLIGQFGRLNPLLDTYNQPDRDINRLIFSRLINFDTRGNPLPDLAETWGVSVSGEVYNITLREGALWHDGELVTTADVAFTIDLMRDAAMPIPADIRALWDAVEVIAFDDRNMQFRLPEPFSPFLVYLSFVIVPVHILAGQSSRDTLNFRF